MEERDLLEKISKALKAASRKPHGDPDDSAPKTRRRGRRRDPGLDGERDARESAEVFRQSLGV